MFNKYAVKINKYKSTVNIYIGLLDIQKNRRYIKKNSNCIYILILVSLWFILLPDKDGLKYREGSANAQNIDYKSLFV